MTQLTMYQIKKIEQSQRIARGKPQPPFAWWDGEGTNEGYALLGVVYGETFALIKDRRLKTDRMLEFLLKMGEQLSDHIHVSFAFTYDVDNILRDMPDDAQEILLSTNEVIYKQYRITWIPRKFLSIKVRGKRELCIYDAFTFFNCSFIKACQQYIPEHEYMKDVAGGKDLRGSFVYEDLPMITQYWKHEGIMGIALMNALRRSMVSAGISLTDWFGPGAVANALIKKQHLGKHIQESRAIMPEIVLDATAYAFFGGRFECFQFGRIPGPIYSYDIRSAYPAALSKMPGLSGGQWKELTYNRVLTKADVMQSGFDWGIYHLTYQNQTPDYYAITPFPSRARDKTVSYGLCADGWYYGHEVKAAVINNFIVTVSTGWQYEGGFTAPFQFVGDFYHQRQVWKEQGNPAQLAAKLGMNSIYGKLCQTVGWDERHNKPPRYHHLWYAGHTTSWCRSRIFDAMMQMPEAIIAVETDGIYSMAPLNLTESDRLGDWEAEVYDEIIYVQNGVYFLRKGDRWDKQKFRGIGIGDISLNTVINSVGSLAPLVSSVHRYGALTGYLGREKHHQWYDQERVIVWGGDGKRRHDTDHCGCLDHTPAPGQADHHYASMGRPFPEPSHPRDVPWRVVE